MEIKFGPGGLGPVKTAHQVLKQYKSFGFKVCEISFTYSNYIKEEQAPQIGELARSLGIDLTVHGSYFINLNSDDPEKLAASKKRILDSCKIGELLGAKCVVFHPGYYGKNKDKAYTNIKKAILEIQKELKKRKYKIKIAPETMGKVNVFGSVEEISQLVKDTGCSFCIDFAHILARDKSVDYGKVERLFPQKDWHVHFSGIIYNEKGERSHKTTLTSEWKELLKNLPQNKNITIVNESPTNIKDSKEGLKLAKRIKPSGP